MYNSGSNNRNGDDQQTKNTKPSGYMEKIRTYFKDHPVSAACYSGSLASTIYGIYSISNGNTGLAASCLNISLDLALFGAGYQRKQNISHVFERIQKKLKFKHPDFYKLLDKTEDKIWTTLKNNTKGRLPEYIQRIEDKKHEVKEKIREMTEIPRMIKRAKKKNPAIITDIEKRMRDCKINGGNVMYQ